MVETISSSSEKRREVKMARARNPGMDGKRCNRKSQPRAVKSRVFLASQRRETRSPPPPPFSLLVYFQERLTTERVDRGRFVFLPFLSTIRRMFERRFDIIGRSVRFFKARNLNESLSRALLLSTSNGHCCPTMGNRGSRGKGIFHRVKELYYWRTIRMRVKVGKFLKRNLFK